MLDESELRSRALATVSTAVREMLKGEYEFTAEDAKNEWDPILKRHTFVQPLVVWRTFDSVRITVSATGEVVAFEDRNRLQNAVFRRLPDPDILRICRCAAVVGPAATVAEVQPGPAGLLLATLIEPFPHSPKRTRITVNPSTRQLAAFEVE